MRIVPYNRNKGVAYAHKWAYGRNPRYTDFSNIGGDCTNFISQCIFAGSSVMNYTPIYGWYYININKRTPSWSGVPFLYNFLVGNKGVGPFGRLIPIDQVKTGDIVQLSFANNVFSHSLYVVSTDIMPNLDNVLVATHTFNSDNRPVSSYSFEKYRVIHIEGVRK